MPHPDSEFPLEHQEDRWDQKRINTGTVSAELCLHYICFFFGGGDHLESKSLRKKWLLGTHGSEAQPGSLTFSAKATRTGSDNGAWPHKQLMSAACSLGFQFKGGPQAHMQVLVGCGVGLPKLFQQDMNAPNQKNPAQPCVFLVQLCNSGGGLLGAEHSRSSRRFAGACAPRPPGCWHDSWPPACRMRWTSRSTCAPGDSGSAACRHRSPQSGSPSHGSSDVQQHVRPWKTLICTVGITTKRRDKRAAACTHHLQLGVRQQSRLLLADLCGELADPPAPPGWCQHAAVATAAAGASLHHPIRAHALSGLFRGGGGGLRCLLGHARRHLAVRDVVIEAALNGCQRSPLTSVNSDST